MKKGPNDLKSGTDDSKIVENYVENVEKVQSIVLQIFDDVVNGLFELIILLELL